MVRGDHRPPGRIVAADIDGFIERGVRAVGLRLSGDVTASAAESRAALRVLDGLSPHRQEQVGEPIAMILRQLSYSLLQHGDLDGAIAAAGRSAALTKVSATRHRAVSYVVGAHAYAGQLNLARAALARIDPPGRPRRRESARPHPMAVVGETFLLLDEGDFDAALRVVRRCESYVETAEFWPFLAAVRLLARIGRGESPAEAGRLQTLLDAPTPPPGTGANTATRTLAGLLAIAWLAAGRLAAAERVLSAHHRRAPELVPARALRLLLTGRPATVLDRLSSWSELPGHTTRTRAATLSIAAAAAGRAGHDALAVDLIGRAHEAAADEGLRMHLSLLPVADRRALADTARRRGGDAVADYLDTVRGDLLPATLWLPVLTRRESIVLTALASVSSRDEIARRLSVSPNTVKTQLRQIYRKLGVTNREAAIRMAARHELIDRPAADGLRRSDLVPAAATPS